MQISDTEVKKILELGSIERQINQTISERQRAEDEALVADIVAKVNAMDDREDRIMDLRARIEAGTYNPSGAEIADAMIRRSIADRIVG